MRFRKMMSVLTLACMFTLALSPIMKQCQVNNASEYFAESIRDYTEIDDM